MIDCIGSVHLDPLTCGVARFNQALAERLDVPCFPLDGWEISKHTHPLVSVRLSELSEMIATSPEPSCWREHGRPVTAYDLFVHDYHRGHDQLIEGAEHVWAANPAIARWLSTLRSDVTTTWCPSPMLHPRPRGPIDVVVFGMGHHRRLLPLYQQLKILLDGHGLRYTVSLSVAVHEDHPFSETFTASCHQLRAIFGDHLRVLGFLGDDALGSAIREASAAALLYDPAVRGNNTSLWTALEAGALVITNLDADSPVDLQHGKNLLNIEKMTSWPVGRLCQDLRQQGHLTATQSYGWTSWLKAWHAGRNDVWSDGRWQDGTADNQPPELLHPDSLPYGHDKGQA